MNKAINKIGVFFYPETKKVYEVFEGRWKIDVNFVLPSGKGQIGH